MNIINAFFAKFLAILLAVLIIFGISNSANAMKKRNIKIYKPIPIRVCNQFFYSEDILNDYFNEEKEDMPEYKFSVDYDGDCYLLKFDDNRCLLKSKMPPIKSFKKFNEYINDICDKASDEGNINIVFEEKYNINFSLNVRALLKIVECSFGDMADSILDSNKRPDFIENIKNFMKYNNTPEVNKLAYYLINSITED